MFGWSQVAVIDVRGGQREHEREHARLVARERERGQLGHRGVHGRGRLAVAVRLAVGRRGRTCTRRLRSVGRRRHRGGLDGADRLEVLLDALLVGCAQPLLQARAVASTASSTLFRTLRELRGLLRCGLSGGCVPPVNSRLNTASGSNSGIVARVRAGVRDRVQRSPPARRRRGRHPDLERAERRALSRSRSATI